MACLIYADICKYISKIHLSYVLYYPLSIYRYGIICYFPAHVPTVFHSNMKTKSPPEVYNVAQYNHGYNVKRS